MTEPRLRELFQGVADFRDGLKDRANRLRSIAARLREADAGWDHEAFLLDAHADELDRGLSRLVSLADGAMDDTQVGIPIDDLANDA